MSEADRPTLWDEEDAVLDLKVHCYGCDRQYTVRVRTGTDWHALCPLYPGLAATGTLGQEGHTTVSLGFEVVGPEGVKEWEAAGCPISMVPLDELIEEGRGS